MAVFGCYRDCTELENEQDGACQIILWKRCVFGLDIVCPPAPRIGIHSAGVRECGEDMSEFEADIESGELLSNEYSEALAFLQDILSHTLAVRSSGLEV
jgi:hypothetical protein